MTHFKLFFALVISHELVFISSHHISTDHHIHKRQIIDRLGSLSDELRQNQTIFQSFLPPILGRAIRLITGRNNSGETIETVAKNTIRPRMMPAKNDEKYSQPIKRKRKFKVDTDELNKPILGRSLSNVANSKRRSSTRSKVVRPIVKLSNLNSKDPFDLKKRNSLSDLQAEEHCYQMIELTTLPIKISSPNYAKGSGYPSNSNCIYNLTSAEAPYEQQIKLNIIDLELEDSKKCEHDYLEIVNSSIRYCGDLKNKVFYLNRSEAILHFHSDLVTEMKGFEIQVSIESKHCKSLVNLYQYEHVITSPNFPNNYPDSVDCWTLIDGNQLQLDYDAKNPGNDQDLSIAFTFEELNMEPDALCNIDYVELFELNLQTMEPQLSLGRFCEYGKYVRIVGDRKNKKNQLITMGNQVHTRNPYLYMHFKSDKLLNSRGFKAKIQVKEKSLNKLNHTCTNTWKADYEQHKIISPSFPHPYPSKFDCSIMIEAPVNQLIQLTFEKFILEPDANCSFDRFLIYEISARNKRSPIGTQQVNLDTLDLRRFLIDNQVIRTSNQNTNQTDRTNDKRDQKRTDGKQSVDLLTRTLEQGKPSQVFCGKKEPNSIYLSEGSKLVLRFVTDDFGEYLGFVINYKFISKDDAKLLRLKEHQKSENENDKVAKVEQIKYEFEPKDAEISIGSSYILKCKPKGYSKLNLINNQFTHQNQSNETIKWYKDGHELTADLNEDRTELLIREFQVSSIGNYKCEFGKSSRQAWLKIKNETHCRSNEILFQRRPQDLITSEGEYPILECMAVTVSSTSLHNKLKITWLHNSKPIDFEHQSNQHLQLLPNNYLLFSEIRKEDTGYYHCQVEVDTQIGMKCQKTSIAFVQVKPKQNVDKFCGRPQMGRDHRNRTQNEFGKIVGGTEAVRGQHPWQVMFFDAKRNSFCGGSVLNQRWLATAAHCFKPNPSSSNPPPSLSQVMVRLGKHDQNLREEGEISTQINEIYFHPEYNPETFDNDLALIQVKDHITFNEFIQPICLGTAELAERNFFSDFQGRSSNDSPMKMGHVTGWGQVRENGPQPRFMQQLKIPLVSMDDCKQSTTFKVTSNMFCAGYGQDTIGDSCKGDSGSPFTVKLDDDRYYLVGIVSWGESCARKNKYGFYTKVNNYLDWINALIKL